MFCAGLGIGALGVVFYPKSPRNVTARQARELLRGLPGSIARVGIFVNAQLETILKTARLAALDTIQLHGEEPAEVASAIVREGFHVVQAIKRTGPTLLAVARALPPSVGILVECGRGALPGGTGTVWNWKKAAPLAEFRPFAIAGGLNAENLSVAARDSRASGFDVSSGVEQSPGIKDHAAIRALAKVVASLEIPPPGFSWK